MIGAYNRARLQRKFMLVIFFSIFVATCLWAIPWLPYGLSVDDYNDRLTMLMLLLAAASVSAFGATYMRDLSRRLEQTMMTWSSVHEGLGDLRRREYFYERVVLECERAEKQGREFSVIVLRLQEPEGSAGVQATLEAFEPMVKEYDCMTVLGPQEVGILAPRIGYADAQRVAQHLSGLLASTAGPETYVFTGWAVYGRDARDAGTLVGIARQRLNGRTSSVAAA